jgi:Tfp pilus assembly protein PilF
MGVASNETGLTTRWMNLASMRLSRFRIYQALRELYNGVESSRKPSREEGQGASLMELLAKGKEVPLDSPEYERGISVFRDNLRDITTTARDNHIPIILCTQVSNVRDLPPFVSRQSLTIDASRRFAAETAINNGITYALDRDTTRARHEFALAISFDSMRADAHYRLAQCLDAQGSKLEARREFYRARDLDQLRFRASSDLNNEIRQLDDGDKVLCADIEAGLAAASPDSIPDTTLLLEHVHPKLLGAFLMAREIVRIMAAHNILAANDDWHVRDTVNEGKLFDRRPITSLDERLADERISQLTSRWPFAEHMRRYSERPPDPIDPIIKSVFESGISWQEAHLQAAGTYERIGNDSAAIREYSVLIEQLPRSFTAYTDLARLMQRRGDIRSAERLFRESLRAQVTSEASRLLGEILLQRGDTEEAIRLLNDAVQFSSGPAERIDAEKLLSRVREPQEHGQR